MIIVLINRVLQIYLFCMFQKILFACFGMDVIYRLLLDDQWKFYTH